MLIQSGPKQMLQSPSFVSGPLPHPCSPAHLAPRPDAVQGPAAEGVRAKLGPRLMLLVQFVVPEVRLHIRRRTLATQRWQSVRGAGLRRAIRS